MSKSYDNIKSFLIDTLKLDEEKVKNFLEYNRIILKRYTTKIDKQNITLSNSNNAVNLVSLVVNNVTYDMTYVNDQDNKEKHVFFYPILKNQTSQSYNVSYTDNFTNLMQFDSLLNIASLFNVSDTSSKSGVGSIVKFLESLFFKLNLPKLSQGIEDGNESFTLTIPLIYFNVDKSNSNSQPYLKDLSILYSYMTSSSSTIKLGDETLNLLKPLDVYAYVELGNGFSYGLCGVESLSYNVDNIRLQYDLSGNNISKVHTNIVYVTVNITFQRIFPNVPIKVNDKIISLNDERNNKAVPSNYFVVSI